MATLSISYATATIYGFTASAVTSDTNLATGRSGTPFSNATTLYVDVEISGTFKTATSLTLNTYIEVYLAAAMYGNASQLTANCPTSEAAFTPGVEKSLLQLVTTVAVTSTATTAERQYDWGPYSIASLYGGTLPSHFNWVVFQNTGQPLATSTATSHTVAYRGITYTSA